MSSPGEIEPSSQRESAAPPPLPDHPGAAEALLHLVLDSAPGFISMLDREWRFTYVNRVVPPFSAAELLGRSMLGLIPADHVERVRSCLEAVVQRRALGTFQVPGPTALDPPRWYSTRVAPLLSGGEVTGVVLVTDDITERKTLEARLLAADRLSALGTMSAGLVHEINNPLTYVLGNLERIALRIAGSSEPLAREIGGWVGSAFEGARRIREVLRDLSSFGHRAQDAPRAIDVVPIVESSIRIAASEMRQRRIELERRHSPLPPLHAPGSWVGQIVLNLLLNAVQAIPPDWPGPRCIRVTTGVRGPDWIVIEVQDTGRGIALDERDRVFEPFYTTRPGGSGIGLWICRSIVRELGGHIELESEPGRGSRFTVLLPAPCPEGS